MAKMMRCALQKLLKVRTWSGKKYLIYLLVYNAGMWEGLTLSVKVTGLKAQRKVISFFFSMKEINGNVKSFRMQNDAIVYSIYQITSYKFSRCSLIQEILLILQNPKLHYRFHSTPPLLLILNSKIQFLPHCHFYMSLNPYPTNVENRMSS